MTGDDLRWRPRSRDGDADPGALRTDGSGADDGGDGDDEEGVQRERVTIKVRPNLLAAWRRQADHAKLSLSKYVVRMVEAGRMSVKMEPASVEESGVSMTTEELADEIRDQLRHEGPLSWEEIVELLSKNLEEEVDEALGRLQEQNEVRYSGLEGGYRLVDEGEQ